MKLNMLLLCNKPPTGQDANTIADHIEAFENYSQHRIWLHSQTGLISETLDLNRFDAIIIHYSLCLFNDYYIAQSSKNRLRDYPGLKIIFIQDEYRQINSIIDELNYIKANILFTCFPPHEMHRIYTPEKLPNLVLHSNLTGYIPSRLLEKTSFIPIAQRPIHVGYRARKIPYWLGELAFEKSNIVDKWLEHAHNDDIKIDLSHHEKDRIYGEGWINFMLSCKTMLGVESGASVMDFTGEIEHNIQQYLKIHPDASFYEVQTKFLKEHEGKYYLNQISPRCFEAIALKTVLVLYEGNYSGILIPDRHYISLKKDFSNIEDVLSKILNDDYLQKMADCAYNEVALDPNYLYSSFIKYVDNIINKEFIKRKLAPCTTPYTDWSFESDINNFPLFYRIYKMIFSYYQKLSFRQKQALKIGLWPLFKIRKMILQH